MLVRSRRACEPIAALSSIAISRTPRFIGPRGGRQTAPSRGNRFSAMLRASDTVGRLGGDDSSCSLKVSLWLRPGDGCRSGFRECCETVHVEGYAESRSRHGSIGSHRDRPRHKSSSAMPTSPSIGQRQGRDCYALFERHAVGRSRSPRAQVGSRFGAGQQ